MNYDDFYNNELQGQEDFYSALNNAEKRLNGYIAIYKGKQIEVRAAATYRAQCKAQQEFQKLFPRRKVKGYDIAIKLVEKDGKPITHNPDF